MGTNSQEVKRNWFRRHARLTTALILLLIVGLVTAYMVHKLNSPSVGTINSQPASQSSSVQQPKPSKYSGTFISFTIPSNYKTVPAPQHNMLETVDLNSTDHSSKSVAIGVVREALNNDSGVTYRRSHPEIYKESSLADGVLFTKDLDGSEYTVFRVHNGLVASISLSSPFQHDLSADYQAIAKSWQWQ